MRTLLILISCALSAPALLAEGLSPISCPTNRTLESYKDQFSSGLACSNGILNFSNFTFQLYQPSGPGTFLTASQIDLTPIGTHGQTGATGFTIAGLNNIPITAVAGQDATYVLDWFFQIDSGPIASGASLGMDPPFGDVTVTQYYCLDSAFLNGPVYDGAAPSCTTSSVRTLSVTTDVPGHLTDSITFNPPAQDQGEVMTVIQLTGGQNGSGFNSVNGTSQIVPEPGGPILLILQFAIGAGMLCRLKSKKTN